MSWSWVLTGAKTQKQIEFRFGAMTSGGAWGNTYKYDQTPPIPQSSFRTEGLTLSECLALQAIANTPLGSTTIVDRQGLSWTGLILNFDYNAIDGTEIYEAEITLNTAEPDEEEE